MVTASELAFLNKRSKKTRRWHRLTVGLLWKRATLGMGFVSGEDFLAGGLVSRNFIAALFMQKRLPVG